MNPFLLPVKEFEVLVLILIRVLAVLATLPVIGNKSVPAMLKVGLALCLAILIFPNVKTENLHVPGDTIPLLLGILGEIGIGLFIGFMSNLVFISAQVAGQFIGYQMGFGIVSVVDPQTQSQLSIIALLVNLFAILLFLSLNIHHILLRAMAESFQLIPLLGGHYPLALMKQLVQNSGDLFVVAVRLGAPIMAVLLFTNVSMGAIARAVPQMNIFIVAFPIQIGVGLIMLGLSLPLMIGLLQTSFFSLEQEIGILLRLIGNG